MACDQMHPKECQVRQQVRYPLVGRTFRVNQAHLDPRHHKHGYFEVDFDEAKFGEVARRCTHVRRQNDLGPQKHLAPAWQLGHKPGHRVRISIHLCSACGKPTPRASPPGWRRSDVD